MEYKQEDFLQISGIQHFAFCKRQWALIHVENQWSENFLTTQGKLMHKNAHDTSFAEKRGNVIIVRDLRVFSRTLGMSGACDVVEFISDESGINIAGRDGRYRIRPVEYKRGKPKGRDMDELQLTAQVICLEEMLCCDIDEGMIFYGEPRRRTTVPITSELREKVKSYSLEMHDMYDRAYTPKVKPGKGCNACSLKDICLPKLINRKKVSEYISAHMAEDI